MKKIELVSRNEVLFVGNAREICSLYKTFLRRGIAEPSFCDFPQFNMARFYGLCISYYDDWNDDSGRRYCSCNNLQSVKG